MGIDFRLRCSYLEQELNDLQKVYNIAMKEIARLRKLLGYDSQTTSKGYNKEDSN